MVIFLDANVLLRFVTRSEVPNTQRDEIAARALFGQIERNEVQATLSEVVLQQTAYFLSTRQHYNVGVEATIEILETILGLDGMRFSPADAAVFNEALSYWKQWPTLGMADCLILARCNLGDHELATFDQKLARVAGFRHWQTTAE